MRTLKSNIERITSLLNQGTPDSLTYAALESRLAIEFVCYERLRVAHKYISIKDLRKWQPRDVVNTLIKEVDEYIASDVTISFAPTPLGDREPTKDDSKSLDWKILGSQVGFDPAKLGRMWHVLSSFLHVRLPDSHDKSTKCYGNPEIVRAKVLDVVTELERLSSGTIISSGVGENVSFECSCGATNTRRMSPLQEGQTISCINPECPESWTVLLKNEITVRRKIVPLKCYACGVEHKFPERAILRVGVDQSAKFTCECGAVNSFEWHLMQAALPRE